MKSKYIGCSESHLIKENHYAILRIIGSGIIRTLVIYREKTTTYQTRHLKSNVQRSPIHTVLYKSVATRADCVHNSYSTVQNCDYTCRLCS